MKRDETKGSIFPDSLPVFTDEGSMNILNEVENLTQRVNTEQGHALLRNADLGSKETGRNDISYLVKTGYPLPEATSPEEMLISSDKKKEVEERDGEDSSPYKMVNLISSSFRLPEIDGENFLK